MRCSEYPVLSLIIVIITLVSQCQHSCHHRLSRVLTPHCHQESVSLLITSVSHLLFTGTRDKISSSEAMSARTISRKSTLGSSAVYGSGLSSSHGSGLARSPSISRSNLGSLKYSTFSSGYSNSGSPGYTFSSYIARSGLVSDFMMF